MAEIAISSIFGTANLLGEYYLNKRSNNIETTLKSDIADVKTDVADIKTQLNNTNNNLNNFIERMDKHMNEEKDTQKLEYDRLMQDNREQMKRHDELVKMILSQNTKLMDKINYLEQELNELRTNTNTRFDELTSISINK